MAEFLSVIECIAARRTDSESNTASQPVSEVKEPVVIDEKELEEQVNDLLEIRKKDILKKNITCILRENFELKLKVKSLENQLKKGQVDSGGGAGGNLSFLLDTDGHCGEEGSSSSSILFYEQTEVLTNSLPEQKVEETVVQKLRPNNTCFNCLGDHMIADCSEPRDQKKIARNRKEFQAKTASFNGARYHVDEPQKFGHLKPGLPSTKLREALRLRENQLPEYIYKMRMLGYPPGWMRHAEISHSGISLYLENGQKLREQGEEEGELRETCDKAQFDIEKLVDWPGFNAPLPDGFRDDTDRYRVPPLSRCIMLEDMIEELKPREHKAYVRGKMQELTTDKNDSVIEINSSTEMEEGEEERDTATNSNEKNEEEEEKAEEPVFGTPTVLSRKSSSASGSVSRTEPGTPIVEMYSPFAKLPKYENFGKDMSEHVVFENLPDYTGTWDKMTGIISKIRQRKEVAEKNSED